MAWVGTYGLNACVMEVSGELSITRVLPMAVAVPGELELELELDEHAASPAASKPAVASAKSRLWLCNLLISLVFLSDFCGYELARRVSTSRGPGTSSGAATSRCQQAAARVAEICTSAGSSRRQRSSANGHLGLNGQPSTVACSRA